MSSEFGRILKISVFGQSHGRAVGVVVDGLPAGEAIQRTFSGWEELHESYLKSYEEWSKKYKSRNLRRQAYEGLIRDPASILNTTPFGMDLRAACREAEVGLE